jgi:hypothetical protein
MSLSVACLELWLGHYLLQQDFNHFVPILPHNPQSPEDGLSLTQVYRDLQNRTTNFKKFCNETASTTTPHLRGRFSLQVPRNCNYPPRSACKMTEYAILMTSTATNPRILFLNLLKALTRSSLVRVLFLDPKAKRSLALNVEYGHRILSWHSNGVVKLWENGLEFIETFPTAVLWMDGDTMFNGSYRDVQVGFELWKRHSDSLVAARAWPLQTTVHTTLSYSNETFLPICGKESLTLSNDESSPLQLVELSGLWMHSDFLCLLAAQSQSDTNKVSISVWLMQLAQPPLYINPMASIMHNDSSWIDESLLTNAVRSFRGMPSIHTRKYCGGEETKPCASGNPELDACDR